MTDSFTLNLTNGTQYPYQIVASKRAKYIRIKLSRQGDLSVTLPKFTKVKLAHEFVESKLLWIEKNLKAIPNQGINTIPDTLDLRLLGEVWFVEYEQHPLPEVRITEAPDAIVRLKGVAEQINNPTTVTKVLNQWCRKKAYKIFNQMLQVQAELHGFHYQRLSIRAQKTRWGSCSHQKNINLNCKLLFMPEEIVKYVMIHELCHTIEMNHSSRFWALVEECDPQYKSHRNQLKSLGKSIIL